MKKLIWVRLNTIALMLLMSIATVALNSCDSEDAPSPQVTPDVQDDDEVPALVIEEYYVSSLAVKDIGNNATAEDLNISFQGAIKSDSITEYRVIVIKSSEKNELTIENALSLNQERYLSITNDKTQFDVILSASQLDFSGAVISEEINYNVAVLTIGTHAGEPVNAISELSETITIDHDFEVTTLVESLNGNDAVTIDKGGNVYVSNFGTYTSSGGTGIHVLKITPEGGSSIFVDGLKGPLGSAFDSQGNFYVISGNNGNKGEIIKVNSSGDKSTLAEISGWPAGIVVDENDNLYVSNYSRPEVHKISTNGEVSVFASDSRLTGGVGIAINSKGDIVVGNYNNGRILSINSSGNVSELTRITGLANNFALGYITILEDIIYATAIGNHKLYKITSDGEYEVYAGNGVATTVDGQLLDASFNSPNGIGADPINNILYIVDWGNKKLRAIDLNE